MRRDGRIFLTLNSTECYRDSDSPQVSTGKQNGTFHGGVSAGHTYRSKKRGEAQESGNGKNSHVGMPRLCVLHVKRSGRLAAETRRGTDSHGQAPLQDHQKGEQDRGPVSERKVTVQGEMKGFVS